MKSIGKLVYSPHTHLSSSEKWLVLMCDDEIGAYYRCLFHREFPYRGKLQRPVWGSHISAIRNETIKQPKLWHIDANKIVEFEYDDGVKSNGEYYWLDARCDFLLDLREQYGLPRQPKYGLHLTIGRTTQ